MTQFYRIYAKFSGQKSFKPLDLSEGVQVNKLIYASLLDKETSDKVLATLKKEYPEEQFESRPAE